MSIILFGISHKVAPIEIREKIFLSDLEQDLLLSELKSSPEIIEAFVISTCNRIEVCVHTLSGSFTIERIASLLSKIKNTKFTQNVYNYFYKHTETAALQHLFEVSTGLDSLVLGEKQILGQTKKAFEKARSNSMLGKYFNILSNSVIRAGKKARSETQIDIGGSSISWAAIRKAETTLTTLEDKSVLIIGAGKMSKLTVGQISNKNFKNLYIMNRTPEHAQKLAEQFEGEYVPFCDLKETLAQVDLCICSSSAPHFIMDRIVVEKSMALNPTKSLLLIDISMPRNLNPNINGIDNVQLFHIDDLQTVVEENKRLREQAIADVQDIIRNKIDEFYSKIKKLEDHSYTNHLETFETST